MPNKLTPQEVAEHLEILADCMDEIGDSEPDDIRALRSSAVDERKIANGELKPVVHGRWEELGGFRHCSKCGHTEYKDFRVVQDMKPIYCSQCGTLMDGKDDSHEID